MTASLDTAAATKRPAAPAKARSYDGRLAIIIAGSLGLHAFILALLLVTDEHKSLPEPQEIPVELVLEPPNPQSPPGGPAGEPSQSAAKQASNQPEAKAETPNKPEDKPQTKPEDKPPEKAAEKPPETPPEKPPEKPQQKPSESQTDKPAAQPPEKAAEKPAGKPAETAAQKSAERRAEKRAEQAAAAQSAHEERAARAAEQQQQRLQQQLQQLQQLQQQRAAAAAPDKRAEAQAAAAFMHHGLMPRSFQAVALPPSAADGEDTMDYEVLVLGVLAREKQYPETAVARGAQGAAAVGFTIDDDGNVLTVALLQSSGQADLDAETLALVRRAAPFPKPPAGYKHYFAATVRFGFEQAE